MNDGKFPDGRQRPLAEKFLRRRLFALLKRAARQFPRSLDLLDLPLHLAFPTKAMARRNLQEKVKQFRTLVAAKTCNPIATWIAGVI